VFEVEAVFDPLEQLGDILPDNMLWPRW
jgi:hypothetical protein